MKTSRANNQTDRLTERREQLVATLRHLSDEQAEVARNPDWIDRAAYESRVALLDELNRWYRAEMKQIDRALLRVRSHEYGSCAACHDPIDPKRLLAVPQAIYCVGCEEFREGLQHLRSYHWAH